ncbi:MAG: undecaprenyl-diphosphate phosphatase [Methanomicrobiales archaeon]|nr:undecaprenyl-diphosphate phosphatase [Methanomicrobiales archaeon]
MDLLQVVFLAILQGFTEWLPVSSSGHLVIAQQLMDLNVSVGFDVALHAGTLVAVLFFFRREIAALFGTTPSSGPGYSRMHYLLLLAAGSIPIALAGIFFLPFFESLFSSTRAVGIGLLLTALLLQLSRCSLVSMRLSYPVALVIGIFQAVALAPGISRSGSTISAALMQGVPREEAFCFSFLLSIPAVIGAMIMKIDGTMPAETGPYMLIGASLAAISGYIAIRILKRILLGNHFHLFSYYCAALGFVTLLVL